jgi:hypothetical protein
MLEHLWKQFLGEILPIYNFREVRKPRFLTLVLRNFFFQITATTTGIYPNFRNQFHFKHISPFRIFWVKEKEASNVPYNFLIKQRQLKSSKDFGRTIFSWFSSAKTFLGISKNDFRFQSNSDFQILKNSIST